MQEITTIKLRTDTPNEVLEMLLFEGPPQHRSREELEARFLEACQIPYLVQYLSEPLERVRMFEEAQALGFDSIAEMQEHTQWLLLNGSHGFRDWYRAVKEVSEKQRI